MTAISLPRPVVTSSTSRGRTQTWRRASVLSLRDKFEELRLRLGTGRRLESTGSEPIFYLVFPVSEILDVKRQTKAWRAKLEHDGWHVVTLSLGETVNEIFRNHR